MLGATHLTKTRCPVCCGIQQAEVFEEVATMDYPFEGIPTIPPRKNTTHMAAFCNGCRYRVTASPDMTVAQVRRTVQQSLLSAEQALHFKPVAE